MGLPDIVIMTEDPDRYRPESLFEDVGVKTIDNRYMLYPGRKGVRIGPVPVRLKDPAQSRSRVRHLTLLSRNDERRISGNPLRVQDQHIIVPLDKREPCPGHSSLVGWKLSVHGVI